GPPVRLILGPVRVVQGDGAPGAVLEAGGDRLVIAAGGSAAALTTVQPAGKRPMIVEEFLRGHRIQPGDRLGPE
ncbi:MAG: methionyl-tRNA formyltransferase, partial [Thermoguttaceae bacterium]